MGRYFTPSFKGSPSLFITVGLSPFAFCCFAFFLWQIFLPRCRMTPWRLFPRRARTTKATSRSKSLHRIKERLQTKPSFFARKELFMLLFQETHLVFIYTIRSRHLTVLTLLLFAFGGSGRTFSRPLSALVLGRRWYWCFQETRTCP